MIDDFQMRLAAALYCLELPVTNDRDHFKQASRLKLITVQMDGSVWLSFQEWTVDIVCSRVYPVDDFWVATATNFPYPADLPSQSLTNDG